MGPNRRKSYKEGGLRQGVGLVLEARAAVRAARAKAFADARAGLLGLYAELGGLIRRAAGNGDSGGERSAALIATLGRALERLYGRAFCGDNLRRMLRFSECYPNELSRKGLRGLRWAHVTALLGLNDVGQRSDYALACAREAWSPERLRLELARRHARPAGRKGAAGARSAAAWPDEPALDADCAEFFGCAESGLGWRDALARRLEDYILGLGAGFCLHERRRRFQFGEAESCLDLVFFHRGLRRLVALAIQAESRPESVPDPMPLYLFWLDQNERQAMENPPAGLVLDAAEGPDGLALRLADGSALPWYLSGLPPKAVVRAFFLRALEEAREQGHADAR